MVSTNLLSGRSDHQPRMNPSTQLLLVLLFLCTYTKQACPQVVSSDANEKPMISLGSDPEYLTLFGESNQVIFAADDGIHGKELWITDTTRQGARLLADIRPGFSPSNPQHMTVFDGAVFFASNDGISGDELYRTDGTHTQLWSDLNPGAQSSSPTDLAVIPGSARSDSILCFAADDGLKGAEPWVLESGSDRASLLKDISPSGSSDPSGPPVKFRDALYFSADNLVNGKELWRTQGTEDTTQLWSDIKASSPSSHPSDFYVHNNLLFFQANGGSGGMGGQGRELYVNDGTRTGTSLVSDIHKEPGESSRPDNFCSFQGLLFFAAKDGVHGRELYVTDGTARGTRLFHDIRYGPASSNPSGLRVWDNKLFFAANDGIHGNELWVVENAKDKTAASVHLFWDVNTGPASSKPSWLTPVPAGTTGGDGDNGKMLFSATDGQNGRELWATTKLAADSYMTEMWTDINVHRPSARSGAASVMTGSLFVTTACIGALVCLLTALI